MKNDPKVMVCVTRQRTCERLIQTGAQIAKERRLGLSVVHVAKLGESFLGSSDEGQALDYLFRISKEVGADMTVLRSENVLNSLIEYAKRHTVNEIVLGVSPQGVADFFKEMEQSLPTVRIRMITS